MPESGPFGSDGTKQTPRKLPLGQHYYGFVTDTRQGSVREGGSSYYAIIALQPGKTYKVGIVIHRIFLSDRDKNARLRFYDSDSSFRNVVCKDLTFDQQKTCQFQALSPVAYMEITSASTLGASYNFILEEVVP